MQTSPEEQPSVNAQFEVLSETENLLPVKVSPFYQQKVDEEVATLGHTEGPLHRGVFPSRERLILRAPGEVPDFVDDRKNMAPASRRAIIRKYRDRLLFLPTQNCLAHCQYCFRQNLLTEEKDGNKLIDMLNDLVQYVDENPEIEEVILSGGDPMSLPFSDLKNVIETIRHQTGVESIRLHTRGLLFSPSVFNDEKAKLFGDNDVKLVSHIIHPYEICDVVRMHVDKLLDHRVKLYNQFPILRHVNDHSEVLRRLLKDLDKLSIRNLSIFIPDPINYSAAFRIRLSRILAIIDELFLNSPSWINSTRLVLDSPHGKVRREDLVEYDERTGKAVFLRGGQSVEYNDFPKDLDQPGELETLLWKDR